MEKYAKFYFFSSRYVLLSYFPNEKASKILFLIEIFFMHWGERERKKKSVRACVYVR